MLLCPYVPFNKKKDTVVKKKNAPNNDLIKNINVLLRGTIIIVVFVFGYHEIVSIKVLGSIAHASLYFISYTS